jgi:ATP-binding cassette subfamily B protein
VDIRKIRYSDLRRQIGMVMQETFLLSGTIAENIAYARPSATMIEIIQAAKAANAHDFIIAKPDGYDTEITQGGANLSTGEKQRLSIARAILCKPKILILDEATASVDLETEKAIQEAIARLVSERTTIAIAHRLSTLRNARRLVVMEKGKVVECGTHEELLKKEDGVYNRLAKLHQETSNVRVVDR